MNTASLVYQVPQGGATIASLAAKTAAATIPVAILTALGLRVTSDATANGPAVSRPLGVSFVPSSEATAAVTLVPGDPTGSPVASVAPTLKGADFVQAPEVVVTDDLGTGQGAQVSAYLEAVSKVLVGGTGYSAGTFAVAYGGLPPGNGSAGATSFTYQELQFVNVSAGGSGYSVQSYAVLTGGITPRGTQAKVSLFLRGGVVTGVEVDDEGDEYLTAPQITIVDPTGNGSGAVLVAQMNQGKKVSFQGTAMAISLTIAGGVITGATVTPGAGYIAVPQILIVDPAYTGSGASIVVSMGVGKYVVRSGGKGYQQPVVTLTPFFKAIFPDTSDQRAPLFNLLTNAISQATLTPVVALAPVLGA